MNPKVDAYLENGCRRCKYFATPQCKVNDWRDELKQLRRIVLDCGLTEERKWGVACYTYQNKNLVLLSAYKAYASLAFFKGALLKDEQNILVRPGENSQAVRQLRYTDVAEVATQESIIKNYIFEAIEVEQAGLQIRKKKTTDLDVPEELKSKFEEMPALKTAFESLTPGRQRGYLLYFTAAKQSKTRVSRIEKFVPKILAGKGMHDRYTDKSF